MIDKNALDRYLTTEPDNGFNEWCELVWDNISDTEITANEVDRFQQFFDDAHEELSTKGSGDGFINPAFSADVIKRTFKVFKKWPHLQTYSQTRAYIALQ